MKRNVTMRVFKCPYCNFKTIAYKSSARRTKKGHLKNLWCPFCKDEHNFIQVE